MTRRSRSGFGKAQPYKRGEMNRTEAAYALLLQAQLRAGVIDSYHYEAMALEIGAGTTWRPDFVVVLPDGEVQLHEVKGRRKASDGRSTWWAEDAAKVKIRAARARWPFRVFVVWPSAGGKMQFDSEEIAA
jgi:hypothetical protein